MVLYCKYNGTEGTWIECWIAVKRYLQGLEVSVAMYLQQTNTTCYVELFVLTFICMLSENLNLWQCDVCCTCLYTCTSIHMRYCHWKLKLWYDAEVLDHIWNELIDCNANMLGC